jgi:hypothetical protein
MGYFAAAAMKTASTTPPALPANIERTMQRLDETNVDELSPRQALDVLYALKNDLEERV